MADFSGGSFRGLFWRIYLAGFMASKTSGFLKKRKAEEKEVECALSRPVNCIMIIVCSQ
jgi:hypothetical protein